MPLALKYAHGAGQKGLEWVTWITSATDGDTLNCNSCHDVTKRNFGKRRELCLFDTTHDEKTISNYAKHMNGTLDVWK